MLTGVNKRWFAYLFVIRSLLASFRIWNVGLNKKKKCPLMYAHHEPQVLELRVIPHATRADLLFVYLVFGFRLGLSRQTSNLVVLMAKGNRTTSVAGPLGSACSSFW